MFPLESGKAAHQRKAHRGQVMRRRKSYKKRKNLSASRRANDRRVTASGALVPGTYATTEEDAKHVKTGRDAMKRYGLRNPKPAVYVFTIDPPIRTKLKRGVAQPAYGQPGGGVEVIFVNGSPDKTVMGPAQIP